MMSEPTKTMTAADEARAWIERLVRFADECNAQNEANPAPEENCPPTHFAAVVRLKPLPDGRVSMYEPGVEVTPDRLRAFLAEHDEQRGRAEKAEAIAFGLQQRLEGFGDERDMAGWTAEENAEFEELYGVRTAMRLRAANDRVWAVVQWLRDEAVKAGRDPYQDPMAQRLSAALVGVDDA
jgi:hypothetical protein